MIRNASGTLWNRDFLVEGRPLSRKGELHMTRNTLYDIAAICSIVSLVLTILLMLN